MEIFRINGEWVTRLTDPDSLKLFGTEFLPLPFTPQATMGTLADFYRSKGKKVGYLEVYTSDITGELRFAIRFGDTYPVPFDWPTLAEAIRVIGYRENWAIFTGKD